MKTFSEYRQEQKELILEMPMIDGSITPEGMSIGAKPIRDYITANHSSAAHIGG